MIWSIPNMADNILHQSTKCCTKTKTHQTKHNQAKPTTSKAQFDCSSERANWVKGMCAKCCDSHLHHKLITTAMTRRFFTICCLETPVAVQRLANEICSTRNTSFEKSLLCCKRELACPEKQMLTLSNRRSQHQIQSYIMCLYHNLHLKQLQQGRMHLLLFTCCIRLSNI